MLFGQVGDEIIGIKACPLALSQFQRPGAETVVVCPAKGGDAEETQSLLEMLPEGSGTVHLTSA